MSGRQWCNKLHRLTVGKSSATASRSQTTPSRMEIHRSIESTVWKEALQPYLVPQEASQFHRINSMTAQAGQTKEHDDKQDDISDKWHYCAESDAVQVVHTIDFPPYRAQL